VSVTAAAEGTTYEVNGETYTVGPKCDQNSGFWVCTTHSEVFQNQFQKDGHIRKGRHALAWVCLVHGSEVP
jgi:hypothetical protein